MPKLTIKGKEVNLVNPLKKGAIGGNVYNEHLEQVQDIMNSPENKGKSVEEIFDTLITEDKDEFAKNETEDYINGKLEDKRNELRDEYRENSAQFFKNMNHDIYIKWDKKTPAQVGKMLAGFMNGTIPEGVTFKEALEQFAHMDIVNDETYKKDPEKLETLKNYRNMAVDINNYLKRIGGLDVTSEQYVENQLKNFDEMLETDGDYEKFQNQLKEEKPARYKQERESAEKNYVSPLQNSKEIYVKANEQFKEVLQERENLVNNYNKTNIFSRIARWCLPNSWSKAGQIQNEIDKIDKAIKEAGYNKEDVDKAQKEINEEKPIIENDNLENQAEVSNELNGPETTEELVMDLKDKTASTESEKNKSQAVENDKNLQREEVITQ